MGIYHEDNTNRSAQVPVPLYSNLQKFSQPHPEVEESQDSLRGQLGSIDGQIPLENDPHGIHNVKQQRRNPLKQLFDVARTSHLKGQVLSIKIRKLTCFSFYYRYHVSGGV